MEWILFGALLIASAVGKLFEELKLNFRIGLTKKKKRFGMFMAKICNFESR